MLGSLTFLPPKLGDCLKLSTSADQDRKRKPKDGKTRLTLRSLRKNQPHRVVQGNCNLSPPSTPNGAEVNLMRLIKPVAPLRPTCPPAGFFSAGYPSFTTALLSFLQETLPTMSPTSGSGRSSVAASRALDSLYSIASKVPRRKFGTAISKCAPLAPDTRKTVQAGDLRVTRVSLTDRDAILFFPLPRPSVQPAGTTVPSLNHERALKQVGRTGIVSRTEKRRHSTHRFANGNEYASGKRRDSSLLSVSLKDEERNVGFPRDMIDILQQLEDLAKWVRATSHRKIPAVSGTKCRHGDHHLSRWMSPTSRHMASSTTPCEGKTPTPYPQTVKSEQEMYVNPSGPAATRAFPAPTVAQDYCGATASPHHPNNITGFLAGDSGVLNNRSTRRGLPSHRRPLGALAISFGNRSACYRPTIDTCPAPSFPQTVHHIASPCRKVPTGISFQRSGWRTTAIPPAIPADHVPVESPYSRRKKMRFPRLGL